MNGFGRGNSFRFRGTSPTWPYVGIGRGGYPRGAYGARFANRFPAYPGVPSTTIPNHTGGSPTTWGVPTEPDITPRQEIEYLQGQTEVLKNEMEHIQSRIEELEQKK